MVEIAVALLLGAVLFIWFMTRTAPVETPEPIKLWLDDERPAPAGWMHVKTAPAAISVIKNENVGLVSLDHDLGPETAGNGYDVMLELERMAYEGKPTPNIYIHTANPVASSRMHAALTAINQLKVYNNRSLI